MVQVKVGVELREICNGYGLYSTELWTRVKLESFAFGGLSDKSELTP